MPYYEKDRKASSGDLALMSDSASRWMQAFIVAWRYIIDAVNTSNALHSCPLCNLQNPIGACFEHTFFMCPKVEFSFSKWCKTLTAFRLEGGLQNALFLPATFRFTQQFVNEVYLKRNPGGARRDGCIPKATNSKSLRSMKGRLQEKKFARDSKNESAIQKNVSHNTHALHPVGDESG